jgi:hypothetical protein
MPFSLPFLSPFSPLSLFPLSPLTSYSHQVDSDQPYPGSASTKTYGNIIANNVANSIIPGSVCFVERKEGKRGREGERREGGREREERGDGERDREKGRDRVKEERFCLLICVSPSLPFPLCLSLFCSFFSLPDGWQQGRSIQQQGCKLVSQPT